MFASFSAEQGDDIAIREVLELLDAEERSHVSTVCYDGDTDVIISLFAKAKYVVGTRFHSVVLGLLCGAQVLPIVYSVKTSNMLEDFHQPYATFDDLPATMDGAPIAYMDDATYEKTHREAVRQFAGLDRFLEEKARHR